MRTGRRIRRPAVSVLAASLALAGPLPAGAQRAPYPGNPLDQLPQAPSRATSDVEVRTAPPPAPAVAVQQVTPTRFAIEGVRSIDFAQVARLFEPLAGKPVAVTELVARAQQAGKLYTEAGYALSFFFVPAQDFAGGVVRIVAVEGHVAQVKVQGETGRSRERIEAISAHVGAEKPLRLETFQRYTALLSQLPGFTIVADIPAPATTDGAATMTLTVKRKAAVVSVGGELTQPQPRAVVSGELNDVLTPGGQLSGQTLLFPRGKEKFHAVAYAQPLGSEGLVLRASASLYESDTTRVAVGPATLERDNGNRRAELSASYPLILTATRSLVLSGGFYATHNRDVYRNAATAAWMADDTHARTLYAQLAWAGAQPGVDRSASVMFAQGIDGLGARAGYSSNLPGVGGGNGVDLKFSRVLVHAAESRRWPREFGTAASLIAQYSPNTLPVGERITFGGARMARGYAPGDASGDSGLGLSLEVNRRFAPLQGSPLRLEPYLLVEAAEVRTESGEPLPAHLRSLALGLRVSDQKHYTVDLAIAKPVGDASPQNPDRKPRANLLLNYRLGD